MPSPQLTDDGRKVHIKFYVLLVAEAEGAGDGPARSAAGARALDECCGGLTGALEGSSSAEVMAAIKATLAQSGTGASART